MFHVKIRAPQSTYCRFTITLNPPCPLPRVLRPELTFQNLTETGLACPSGYTLSAIGISGLLR